MYSVMWWCVHSCFFGLCRPRVQTGVTLGHYGHTGPRPPPCPPAAVVVVKLLFFQLCLDHVLLDSLVGFYPSLARCLVKIVAENLFEREDDGISHGLKHGRLDTVSYMLDTEFRKNFRQQFGIRAEKIQGRIQHLHHVAGMHGEALRLDQILADINVNGKAKEHLGLGSFDKETAKEIKGKMEVIRQPM